MVVARLPCESVAVITFVPGDCVGTRKVREKVPDEDEMVVVMVRWVLKEMEIILLSKNDEPQIVISLPARADEGETEILERRI